MDNDSAIFPKRMILRFAKKKKRKIEKKYYEICPKKMLKLVWISCIIVKVSIETRIGGVAQLGERYTGSVEVMGSNPTVSTLKKRCKIKEFTAFFFWN